MDEESKKQLLQKKIFDNPELYISTHVTFIRYPRSSVKFVISIFKYKWSIITLEFTLNKKKEQLKYYKEDQIIDYSKKIFKILFNSSKKLPIYYLLIFIKMLILSRINKSSEVKRIESQKINKENMICYKIQIYKAFFNIGV